MAEMIKNIRATIQTATDKSARRTLNQNPSLYSGEVYLGLGGREFRCKIAGLIHFREGDRDTFRFGSDNNVSDERINDPQNTPMKTVQSLPVYIRYERRPNEDDMWCVEQVDVSVGGDDNDNLNFSTPALDGEATIWLGPQSGSHIYLS
jgi:hypothetical protein